ncbi:MAG TPA: hypothetical protein PKD52_07085 [Clostridiales bacterium]|nr:hypothetical protein [Clostridiales bacterium]
MGLLLWLGILMAMLCLDRCFVVQSSGKRRKQRRKRLSLARR